MKLRDKQTMEMPELNNWDENGSQGTEAHPPPERLLLAVDGELLPDETARIEAHLAACWLCRARTAKIEATIADFIEYNQTVLEPQITPPPETWRSFSARLDHLAAELGQLSLLARLGARLRGLLAVRLSMARLAALTAIALLVVAGFWLKRSPGVSAQELLQRSIQAEQARFDQALEPLVYRKLRARRKAAGGEALVTWESWRSAKDKKDKKGDLFKQRITDEQGRFPARTGEAPALLTELERVFQANRLDFERPLSAKSFADWRATVRLAAETVTEVALEDQSAGLKLTAVVAEPRGPDAVVESSLIVRRANWHPVAQYLKVQGEKELREYELIELAYEVMPLAALTIFAEPSPMTLTLSENARNPMPTPSVNSAPTEAELTGAEIEALYTLHQLQADLGEQIEVVRDPAGQVMVRGLVDTAARKEQLTEALRGLTLVTTQIQTVEEAQRAAAKRLSALTTVIPAVETEPNKADNRSGQQQAFRAALTKCFASSGATTAQAAQRLTELTNRSLAHSEAALARAWAIRRLAENPTLKPADKLAIKARSRLVAILEAHQKELRKEAQELQAMLEPCLTFISGGKPARREPPASNVSDWVEEAQRVFRSVSQTDRLLHRMLGASGPESEPMVAAQDALAGLAEIEAALRALEAQTNRITVNQ